MINVWANNLEQSTSKRDVAQRYLFRITSLASHIPGLEAYSAIAHGMNALSAIGTGLVLSMHTKQFHRFKKRDLKSGHRRRRILSNSAIGLFHTARVSILTYSIFALTGAVVSCISSFFLFGLSAHSAFKNALSWRQAKKKSTTSGLIQDRAIKITALNNALTNSNVTLSAERRNQYQQDLLRLQNQWKALVDFTRSSNTIEHHKLANYLLYKQHQKIKISRSSTYANIIGAVSAVSLGLAFFFPPAGLITAALGIIGSVGYAVSAIYRITNHHSQTGWSFKLFSKRIKTHNQRRYERVMAYCVERVFNKDKQVQLLKHQLENASNQTSRQTAGSQLQKHVESLLVRRHLDLSDSDNLSQMLSNSDRRNIVHLQCEALDYDSRMHLLHSKHQRQATPIYHRENSRDHAKPEMAA